MTAVLRLAISRDILLTSNDRIHWREKARRTRAIREMAHILAKHERPAKMPAATCEASVKWSFLKRIRDAHNLQPTVKAAIDGVVGDYGLLPSDSDRHLRALTFTSADETHSTPGVACFLTLTFTEAAE
jgi:hypothetical protein